MSIPLHEMAPLTLWGSTRVYNVKLDIFINHDVRAVDWDACTDLHHGKPSLHLHPKTLKNPKRLRRILIHEFTHILEYLNDAAAFDPTRVDECSVLAQTMEIGMADLICNLRVGQRKFKW